MSWRRNEIKRGVRFARPRSAFYMTFARFPPSLFFSFLSPFRANIRYSIPDSQASRILRFDRASGISAFETAFRKLRAYLRNDVGSRLFGFITAAIFTGCTQQRSPVTAMIGDRERRYLLPASRFRAISRSPQSFGANVHWTRPAEAGVGLFIYPAVIR